MLTPDQEETARLVMMDMRDRGDRSVIRFNADLRAELGNWNPLTLKTVDIAKVWQKYMGIDQLHATHNLDTGERLK